VACHDDTVKLYSEMQTASCQELEWPVLSNDVRLGMHSSLCWTCPSTVNEPTQPSSTRKLARSYNMYNIWHRSVNMHYQYTLELILILKIYRLIQRVL